MTSNEVLFSRTMKFAHDCVKVVLNLPKNKLGFPVQLQIIKCSTSIAVNHRATNLAQSNAAFNVRPSIVIEEADESKFWLHFGTDVKISKIGIADLLIKEARELASIFNHQENL